MSEGLKRYTIQYEYSLFHIGGTFKGCEVMELYEYQLDNLFSLECRIGKASKNKCLVNITNIKRL